MTDPVGHIVKTRICARLEQALNGASLVELAGYARLLQGGMPLGDLLTAQWDAKHPQSLSRTDQKHLLNHVFGRNGQGWWGPDVEAIASEGMAQALQRMLYDLDGKPRKTAKRIDVWWMLPGTYHFYNAVMESEQQVTLLWVTPPKGDQEAAYALYREQLALAEKTLRRPRDPGFVVPDDLTRPENTWHVTAARWALTHGVDAKGKPRACAEVIRLLTKAKGKVVVTRPLCEAYRDRYPQTQVGKIQAAKGGKRRAR